MELIEIIENGTAAKPINDLTDMIKEVMSSTAELYASVGYVPPWIGYLAIEGNKCAGTCAFKSPPENNRVEIAYFTFPEFEGRGVATRMAQTLLQIAFEAVPELTIAAQTLPEENASNIVLRKLGFQFFAELEHPEDGKIWEWRLKNSKKN
ncbi:MAG: GNAT family N-acetyltransferase [Methanosarcina sp.]|jgi:RimJ/RimL family protein N-acetyltransferase